MNDKEMLMQVLSLFLNKSEKQKESSNSEENIASLLIGKMVLIRGCSVGLYIGILEKINGKEVLLKNCRNIYYWEGALSNLDIAENGCNKVKLSCIKENGYFSDIYSVFPLSEKSINFFSKYKNQEYKVAE
jgi:hypothetical protein